MAISFFAIILLSDNGVSAITKTYVWITVDTESTYYSELPDQLEKKVDGESCGISRMLDICDHHNVKATFFLNVYEYKRYGEEKIKYVARYIDHRGHDVQLHTHPDWAYDQDRKALWQYSLDEQVQIIEDGKTMLQQWIGKPPIAHRAGGYLADNNTIKALTTNGIFLDSSFFYGNPTCKIKYPNLEINLKKKLDQLWEIPVTLYISSEVPGSNLFNMEPISRHRKIDIDWASYADLESALKQIQNSDVDYITLFLHSFSFISEKNRIVTKDIEKLDKILSYIDRSSDFEVVTSQTILTMLNNTKTSQNDRDFVPTVHTSISYLKYFKRRYWDGKNGNIANPVETSY